MSSTRDLDAADRDPAELPPFVLVPEHLRSAAAPPAPGRAGGSPHAQDPRELLARLGVAGRLDTTRLRQLLTRLGISGQVDDSQLRRLLAGLDSGGLRPGGSVPDPGADDGTGPGTGAVHT